ncbi:MAG: amidohydrolase family protein, partial [Pseudomonadota bacterium]
MTSPPFVTPPDPNPKTPKYSIPAGACDCHFHVFDGPSPPIASRSYSAHAAPLSAYRSVQKTLGLDRSVIVQPSIYGTDNRTTMNAVSQDGSMKAIVVVGDQTRKEDLKALAARGAVGARLNLMFSQAARVEMLFSLTSAMADLGWHIQILADVSKTPDLMPLVRTLPVPVVFDHMGHVQARSGVDDPGFQ